MRDFLSQWRKDFRAFLSQDPNNVLGRKFPLLAESVTDNFPSIDVLYLYAQLMTSWTVEQVPDQSNWRPRQPHLAEISILCEKYFSWGSSGEMVTRFRDTLWPGVAIRYLLAQVREIIWNLAIMFPYVIILTVETLRCRRTICSRC